MLLCTLYKIVDVGERERELHRERVPMPLTAQKNMPWATELQNAKPVVMVPQMKQPQAVTFIRSKWWPARMNQTL